jgi:prefoldin subunit 5
LKKDQMENRLDELRAELQSGQRALAELQARETEMGTTLSRLRQAIQVLEEELGKENTVKPVKAPGPVTVRRIKELP